VRSLKQYRIPFGSLKEGVHEYEFDLDSDFFSLKENSLIQQSDLKSTIDLHKRSGVMELKMKATGWYQHECDSCLEEIRIPLNAEDRILVKFSDHSRPLEDGVMILENHVVELEVYDLLYELVCLNLPMTVKCEDSLNRTACRELVQVHAQEQKEQDEVDPRWDKLKELLKRK
jgi:uncharacterized metal-binding protein YceD (DUF177 family)